MVLMHVYIRLAKFATDLDCEQKFFVGILLNSTVLGNFSTLQFQNEAWW